MKEKTIWNTIKTFPEATLTSMLPVPLPSAYIQVQWIKVIIQNYLRISSDDSNGLGWNKKYFKWKETLTAVRFMQKKKINTTTA